MKCNQRKKPAAYCTECKSGRRRRVLRSKSAVGDVPPFLQPIDGVKKKGNNGENACVKSRFNKCE